MAKIPFIGQTVRLYTTAYYAREWGNLLGQGVDLLDLVALMQEQSLNSSVSWEPIWE